ncbi:MAG: hypothetical protein M3121_06305 [Chloroflexota bacterium]|nr:hypothetical protein [Chloroflexota bacterium]
MRSMRIAARTVLELILTVLLMWLLTGVVMSIDNTDPASVFVNDAPALIFGLFWIGLLAWVLLVTLGNVIHRNRPPRARVLHNLLSALGAAVLVLIVYTVIGVTAGGFGMLIVGIALIAAIAFLIAAAIAVPLTHLVILRPRAPAPSPAPPSTTAA